MQKLLRNRATLNKTSNFYAGVFFQFSTKVGHEWESVTTNKTRMCGGTNFGIYFGRHQTHPLKIKR
jgi:hypothetical protein